MIRLILWRLLLLQVSLNCEVSLSIFLFNSLNQATLKVSSLENFEDKLDGFIKNFHSKAKPQVSDKLGSIEKAVKAMSMHIAKESITSLFRNFDSELKASSYIYVISDVKDPLDSFHKISSSNACFLKHKIKIAGILHPKIFMRPISVIRPASSDCNHRKSCRSLNLEFRTPKVEFGKHLFTLGQENSADDKASRKSSTLEVAVDSSELDFLSQCQAKLDLGASATCREICLFIGENDAKKVQKRTVESVSVRSSESQLLKNVGKLEPEADGPGIESPLVHEIIKILDSAAKKGKMRKVSKIRLSRLLFKLSLEFRAKDSTGDSFRTFMDVKIKQVYSKKLPSSISRLYSYLFDDEKDNNEVDNKRKNIVTEKENKEKVRMPCPDQVSEPPKRSKVTKTPLQESRVNNNTPKSFSSHFSSRKNRFFRFPDPKTLPKFQHQVLEQKKRRRVELVMETPRKKPYV